MINKIYNENCLDTMARMPDNYIDLTVTSPPYDNLRKYKGYEFDFESIAKELYRVTNVDGVVVWIVGDATIKGCETLKSFKQALYFKEIGFNIETMIWHKPNPMPGGSLYLYQNSFEYMFICFKGKSRAKIILKDVCDTAGNINTRIGSSGKDGWKAINGKRIVRNYKRRSNVWYIAKAAKGNGHPAVFPEKLAEDHILSWSNKNDIVYDPMAGSGTTIKMAIKNNRNWIGSEISEEYCEIIKNRIENT